MPASTAVLYFLSLPHWGHWISTLHTLWYRETNFLYVSLLLRFLSLLLQNEYGSKKERPTKQIISFSKSFIDQRLSFNLLTYHFEWQIWSRTEKKYEYEYWYILVSIRFLLIFLNTCRLTKGCRQVLTSVAVVLKALYFLVFNIDANFDWVFGSCELKVYSTLYQYLVWICEEMFNTNTV